VKEITYGTGATSFSDGSKRLITTLKKKSRVRKKRKKRKGY